MFATIEAFYEAAQPFIDAFNEWVSELRNAAVADHIGYKCASSEEFESLRARLERESSFVYQSMISERRIAVIKLTQAIPTLLGDIRYLELSDQKPDQSQVSGFDHIEIYPAHVSVDDMVDMLALRGITPKKTVHPHHTTHDIHLENGFRIRLEKEPLIEKIKREEMGHEGSHTQHTPHRAAIDFPT